MDNLGELGVFAREKGASQCRYSNLEQQVQQKQKVTQKSRQSQLGAMPLQSKCSWFMGTQVADVAEE